ncbi:pseudouridine synthase [Marvinbryantia formatexigens]|nr:pseudouridine synthase [Marvinbryantia formatexigens]UWO24734.1 pseudouridine synthase [Marvinbryantia formatexigens DSM 14469]SDF21158.1 23S rRNA pseudouridine2604 synthase [Marvinbryantia formatexigens]
MASDRTKEDFRKITDTAEPVRINKYLAQAGICSRREADRLIAEGKVLVDGAAAVAGQKVLPSQDIRVEGEQAVRSQERILLVVNKPRGVVCTTDKTWGDTTLEELVDYPSRVFYAGRLDKDSEGLILMTNDGELQDKIMRAANRHEKEYLVKVDRTVDDTFLKKMAKGVYLRELDTVTRPCRVEKTGRRAFRIVLTQGLNRQIRRMCAALGYQVQELRRVRIMNIRLGGLPAGQYREATDEELREICALAEAGKPVRM